MRRPDAPTCLRSTLFLALALAAACGGSQSSPADAVGVDTWSLRVTDTSGQPLSDLSLSAVPFMPDHQHGPSVVPQVASKGGGNYTVSNLDFFMPGVWMTTFTSASPSDSAKFFFCIPG